MYYKIKKAVLLLIMGGAISSVSAQIVRNKVKVGDNYFTIDKSAVLEAESVARGFLPPRMTKLQRNEIKDPTKGLQVWCTDCNFLTDPPSGQLCVYLGTAWVPFVMVATPGVTTNTATITPAKLATITGTLVDFYGVPPDETGVVWKEITANDFATLPVLDDSGRAVAPDYKTATSPVVVKAGDPITITDIPLVSATGGKRPYYFRTYARNSFGIGYGKPVIYNVAPPAISNPVVSNGNTLTPVFTGTLTVNAGTPQGTIKEYGYCSSMTNDKPTIADNKVELSATAEGIAALKALDASLKSETFTADPVINLAVPVNLSKTYLRYYVTATDGTTYYSDQAASFTDSITGGTAVATVTHVDNLSAGVPLQLSVEGTGTIKVHFKVTKAGTYAGFVPESTTGSTTGLTMSPVPAGTFAVGEDQTLTFTVSGTPETAIEGNVFTVSRIPLPLATGAIQPFKANCNGAAPTTAVDIYSKTGNIWMDRNLGASRAATTYNDYKAQGCLYQWGRGNDDHASIKWTSGTAAGAAPVNGTTTTLSQGDKPGNASFIIPDSKGDDWHSKPPANTPWQGVNGVNNPCPYGYRIPTYAEFAAEINAYSIKNTATAYETFKFTRNSFRSSADGKLSDGSRAYYWTSTVSSASSTKSLAFSFDDSKVYPSDEEPFSQGFSVRCMKGESEDQDLAEYTVTKSDPISNSFKMGQTSGGTIKVHFKVTKAGKYKNFVPESMSGATTGLSLATVFGGNFAVGDDKTLDFTISGTPAASLDGNSFVVSGIKNYTLNTGKILADVSVPGDIKGGAAYCDESHKTAIEAVYSGKTGRVWMDRNLGASRAATSIDDFEAYGCLFQWGRGNDGHASINWTSATAGTPVNETLFDRLSDSDTPQSGAKFLTTYGDDWSFFDWRRPQNPQLWQGLNGINNPCPRGYRIPSVAEIENESIIKNRRGGYESLLKLVGLGVRSYSQGGKIVTEADGPSLWTSNVGTIINKAHYGFKAAYRYHTGDLEPVYNAYGLSVRCIRDNNNPATDGKAVVMVTKIEQISNPFKLSERSRAIVRVHIDVSKGGVYQGFEAVTPTGATTGLSMEPMNSVFLKAGKDQTIDFYITGQPDGSREGNYFDVPRIGVLKTGKILGFDIKGTSAMCDKWSSTKVVKVQSKTGKIWMDRNLGASSPGTGIQYDYNAYGCLYQWGRGNDNHASIDWSHGGDPMDWHTSTGTSSTDYPEEGVFFRTGNIGNWNDWRSPQNNNLWQGVNGINNPCPEGYRVPTNQELTEEINVYGLRNTADALASPFKFAAAGNREFFNASLSGKGFEVILWTSTVVPNETAAYFRIFDGTQTQSVGRPRTTGASVRCIKDKSEPDDATATVTKIDPISSVLKINLFSKGTITTHFNVTKAGAYRYVVTDKKGATEGLTMSEAEGDFAVGNDQTAVFSVNGIPTTSLDGNSFVVSGIKEPLSTGKIKGYKMEDEKATCDQSHTTTVVPVVSNTGRVWMDRNLGASRAGTGTAQYDYNAYGCLYQWGRGNDDHASIDWSWTGRPERGGNPVNGTTPGTSSTDNPGNLFINTGNINLSDKDWRSPQNNNLWQGLDGINNPCPQDYRVPTSQELADEVDKYGMTNAADAAASPFKFVAAGVRQYDDGKLYYKGENMMIWTSTVDGPGALARTFRPSETKIVSTTRSYGATVRCIKDKSEDSATGRALCDESHKTKVETITSSGTGKIWMDRNLGASRRAVSSDDYQAYGCLFQWGRGNDGHASINWSSAKSGAAVNAPTPAKSGTDIAGHSNFIITQDVMDDIYDWRSVQSDNLWQGPNGVNNPCPTGYKVPSIAEFQSEIKEFGISNIKTAYKYMGLVLAGHRKSNYGGLWDTGISGYYWTSTVAANRQSTYLAIISSSNNSSEVKQLNFYRAYGFSVRCVKDEKKLTP